MLNSLTCFDEVIIANDGYGVQCFAVLSVNKIIFFNYPFYIKLTSTCALAQKSPLIAGLIIVFVRSLVTQLTNT